MLRSPARAERVLGLQAIVRAGAPQLLPRLIEHLQDPADELRLAAAVALETMSEARISPDLTTLIVAQLHQLAGDRIERVRQAAIVVLSRLEPDSPLLIAALADPALPVREAAIMALGHAGTPATPALLAALASDDLLQAAMAAVALTRIKRSEFAALIDSYITRCMQAIHRNYTYLELVTPYRSFAGGDILCGILNEQADRWGDTLFDLLGALHPPEAVRLIGASLRHPDPLTRANATEALETLLPPQLAHMVAALCDPGLDLPQKVQVGAAMWPDASLDAAVTLRQLLDSTNDPWLRAVVAFLLGELGATLAEPVAPALVAGGASEGADAPPMTTISAGVGGHAGTWLSSRAALAAKLLQLQDDPSAEVRLAAQSAQRLMAQSAYPGASAAAQQLSNVEKVILLKGVTFFQGMTTAQLCLLASVCEEEQHPQDSHIFRTGEPGESLYIVISGRVGIEQERRRGTMARLATLSSRDFFGEIGLFMGGERDASAIALQDTLTLRLRRAPLIELVRQRPDLSLTLINVLSRRLREAHDQIAELTHVWPKKLDQLLDQLETP
jgi:CRP-like cAMP-binding protein/HEAT repeat protein